MRNRRLTSATPPTKGHDRSRGVEEPVLTPCLPTVGSTEVFSLGGDRLENRVKLLGHETGVPQGRRVVLKDVGHVRDRLGQLLEFLCLLAVAETTRRDRIPCRESLDVAPP